MLELQNVQYAERIKRNADTFIIFLFFSVVLQLPRVQKRWFWETKSWNEMVGSAKSGVS